VNACDCPLKGIKRDNRVGCPAYLRNVKDDEENHEKPHEGGDANLHVKCIQATIREMAPLATKGREKHVKDGP
jgi:hypothetical protein